MRNDNSGFDAPFAEHEFNGTNGVAAHIRESDEDITPIVPLIASRLTEVPDEWYSEEPPKRSWLLRDTRHPKARGVLPLGKVGQLIAEGGGGKTMMVCGLAVSVVTGAPFLGAFSVATPGRVLLVLGEEDAEEARRRLHRAARASRVRAPGPGSIVVLPLAGCHAPMLELGVDGNLSETPFLLWIRAYVKAGDFRLVVIDPLSRFAGPIAETDNAAATRFIQALESLVTPTTTVLNAHHTNKISRGKDGRVDASSGRGSSAFVDGARWQCALSVEYLKHEGEEEQARLGEIVTFTVTKSNYAAKPDPVVLRRDPDNGGALVPIAEDDGVALDRARSNAATRTAKSEAKTAQNVEREQKEDRAVLKAVRDAPGISMRKLRDAVKAAAGCGSDRAATAIARVEPFLEVRHGARDSSLYHPPATAEPLPPHLRLSLV